MAECCVTIIGGGLAGAEAAWQAARGARASDCTRCARSSGPQPHQTDLPRRAGLQQLLEIRVARRCERPAQDRDAGAWLDDPPVRRGPPRAGGLGPRRGSRRLRRCGDADHRRSPGDRGCPGRGPGDSGEPARHRGVRSVDLRSAGGRPRRTVSRHFSNRTPQNSNRRTSNRRTANRHTSNLSTSVLLRRHLPIVAAESINRDVVYAAARYGVGGADYLNCPLTREEYQQFREALLTGERYPLHEFEQAHYFEGCLPDRRAGRARRGHAAVRPAAAGRPARSADGEAALRGGSAPAGEPGARGSPDHVQPGRLARRASGAGTRRRPSG